MLCLHCIRHALQPFRGGDVGDAGDGRNDDAGLVLALGCPVRSAGVAAEATVSFEVDYDAEEQASVVRLVAAKDIKDRRSCSGLKALDTSCSCSGVNIGAMTDACCCKGVLSQSNAFRATQWFQAARSLASEQAYCTNKNSRVLINAQTTFP